MASAATPAAGVPAAGTTAQAEVHSAKLSSVQKADVRSIKALDVGQSHTIANTTTTVTRTPAGLSVDSGTPVLRASFCGTALATAIIGVGAGALGVLAAVTGGGTVVIAGFLLTGAQVGILAGIAGSYAAVLGYVSTYIC